MSVYSRIDFSKLPKPDVIEIISFENIRNEALAELAAEYPPAAELTEVDPAYKLISAFCYRETLLRQRINEACYAVMLPYAKGNDLDQIGANFVVWRLLISAGDPDATPPTEDVFEDDEKFRFRIALAFKQLGAGTWGRYVFDTLSASGDIKDAEVVSLTPGTANIAILSRHSTGEASQELISDVVNSINDKERKVLCDTISVVSSEVNEYEIAASASIFPGVGQAEVLAASKDSATEYAERQHKLARDITLSGVTAAVFQPGVHDVELMQPAANIVNGWNQASFCTGVSVENGGVDE